MKQLRRTTLALTLGLSCLAGVALAQVVQPTVSGVIQSVGGGIVRLRNEDTGAIWTGRLEPNAKMETSLAVGKKVAMRIKGGLNEKPLRVDLVTDWGNSSQYVAKAAPAPYNTKMGEWVGPGGVGGKPPNAPDPGKTKNVAAYAANGAFPHQNPQDVPNILAPKPQDAGQAKLPKGTPGFQQGPVAPEPPVTPTSEPQPSGVSNTVYPNGDPSTPTYPGTMDVNSPPLNPAYPAPPLPTNPAYPGMNPVYPGMPNPAMPNMYNPNATNGLQSLLNGEDSPNGDGSDNSFFPGMGGNPMAMQGMPVQIQATVLRADPATRTMVVQPVGTQTTQNIMLGPQVMLPPLRQGQMVTIMGSSNPQGFIEAQQVTPYGP